MSGRAYAEVIGDPIAHSKSPAIHGRWLGMAGIDADYRATRVAPEGLADYLAARRADPDWRGCNVTIPHKRTVMPLLDAVDPLAARVGAVNTVVARDGRLTGHNTDVQGFLAPLRPRLAGAHARRTARLLGAGGAARAIAHGLAGEGFHLIVAARDLGQARALAAEAGGPHAHATALDHFATPIAFDWGAVDEDRLDLLVNATPLGMTGRPPLAIDFSTVPPGAIVYDAVYAPLDTPLLAAARARGHPTIDGLRMLIGQARIAFALLFDADPPGEAGDADLVRLLTGGA